MFLNPERARGARNPLIVFFHSQRTGGRALRNTLGEIYGRERVFAVQWHEGWRHWKDLSEADLHGYAAFVGHSNYTDIGIARRDCLFISLVRHPVYRAMAMYSYIKNRDSHELWELANAHDMSSFYQLAASFKPYYFENVQCRRVCGRPKATLAIRFIEATYLAVGSVEALPAFVRAVGSVLGWPKIPLEQVAPDAERYADVWTDTFADMVLEGNSEDMILYDYLRRRYFEPQ